MPRSVFNDLKYDFSRSAKDVFDKSVTGRLHAGTHRTVLRTIYTIMLSGSSLIVI